MARSTFKVFNWVRDFSNQMQPLAEAGLNPAADKHIIFPEDTITISFFTHNSGYKGVIWATLVDFQDNKVNWPLRMYDANFFQDLIMPPIRIQRMERLGTYPTANSTEQSMASLAIRTTLHCYAYGV